MSKPEVTKLTRMPQCIAACHRQSHALLCCAHRSPLQIIHAFPLEGKGAHHGLTKFKKWLDGFDPLLDQVRSCMSRVCQAFYQKRVGTWSCLVAPGRQRFSYALIVAPLMKHSSRGISRAFVWPCRQQLMLLAKVPVSLVAVENRKQLSASWATRARKHAALTAPQCVACGTNLFS